MFLVVYEMVWRRDEVDAARAGSAGPSPAPRSSCNPNLRQSSPLNWPLAACMRVEGLTVSVERRAWTLPRMRDWSSAEIPSSAIAGRSSSAAAPKPRSISGLSSEGSDATRISTKHLGLSIQV